MANLLSAPDEKRISSVVREFEANRNGGKSSTGNAPGSGLYLAQCSSSVAGRVGTTVSKGTFRLYNLTGLPADATRTYSALGTYEEIVWNPLVGEYPANRMAFVMRDSSGDWIILGWDCEEA